MDRNTFTGLFLILIILVGSTFLLKPSSEELKKKAMQDSIALANQNSENQKKVTQIPTKADTALVTDSSVTDTSSFKEETATLENNLIKLSISNIGGRIASVEIKNETTYQGKPVILFNDEDTKFGVTYKDGNSSSLPFKILNQ